MRRLLLPLLFLAVASCTGGPKKAYEKAVESRRDGHFTEAVTRLRELTLEYPDSEYAGQALLLSAGIYTRDLKAYDDALDAYRLFLRLHPDAPEAAAAREEVVTLLYDKKHDYWLTIVECERFAERYPASPRLPVVRQRMILSYMQLQRYEKAREEAERFLSRFADHELADEVAYTIARSYYIESRNEEAITAARNYLALRPEGAYASRAWFLAGKAHEDLDRLRDALAAFEQAKALNYPSPPVVDEKISAVTARLERKLAPAPKKQ